MVLKINEDAIKEIIKYLDIKDLGNLTVNHYYQRLVDNQIKDNFCDKFRLKSIDANYNYLTIELYDDLLSAYGIEQQLITYSQNDNISYHLKELLTKGSILNFGQNILSKDLTKILIYNNLFVNSIDNIFD